jgi:outer membrane protein assembly factor BamC
VLNQPANRDEYRMRSLGKLGTIGLIVLSVAGCSLFSDEPANEQTTAEQLKLPPDLTVNEDDQALTIPEGSTSSVSASGERTQQLLPQPDNVRIRRAGDDRWLQVSAPTDRAWKWVNAFLERAGVGVARREPTLGVVETDWVYSNRPLTRGVFAPTVDDRDKATVADRYLVRVEPGRESGTSEIFVAHRRAARDDSGDWLLRPSDPFLEAEFLRGLMVYLGVQQHSSFQRVAEGDNAPPASRIERNDSDEPVLVVDEAFFEAWRRVGLALDRAGFTVTDRDRSGRQFFVRYDTRAETGTEEEGFLASLAFWRDAPPDTVVRYRIQLQEGEGKTRVRAIRDPKNPDRAPPPDPAIAERILGLLQEQLR